MRPLGKAKAKAKRTWGTPGAFGTRRGATQVMGGRWARKVGERRKQGASQGREQRTGSRKEMPARNTDADDERAPKHSTAQHITAHR